MKVGLYIGTQFTPETNVPAALKEMLEQVQYFASDLQRRMNSLVRQKIDQGAIRPSAGMEIMDHYRDIFNRSTYCETE